MKKLILKGIALYQKYISSGRPPCCRYYPSCSNYAMEAVKRFGVLRGGVLAVWRLLRCNPYSRGGVDYVPLHFTFKRQRVNPLEQQEKQQNSDSGKNLEEDREEK